MAGRNVPIVLIPRFSTYVGQTTCWSQPIPVSAYSGLTFDFWNATMNGAPAAGVQIDVQQSNDNVSWETCQGGSPFIRSPGTGQAQLTAVLNKAWMRFGVTPLGTQPGITCWAQGFFELRER